MPYSYRKENVPRVAVRQREPQQPLLVPQRRRREPLAGSPAPHRSRQRAPLSPDSGNRVEDSGRIPQRSKQRTLLSPVPRRKVRQQKPPLERAKLQMMLGIGLILFSLLIILNRVFASSQLPALQLWPSSQLAQISQSQATPPSVQFPIQKISNSVTAFAQADKKQYNNENPEWSQWSYSACSGCAMAALMDAYGANISGRPLNCGDVLEVEKHLSVYSPVNEWGLINGSPDELAQTATQFGFTAHYTQKLSLDDLIALANAGVPSVIRIPTHIMLLTGGDSQHVYLADSGGLHLSQVTRTQFLHGLPGSRLYAGQSWMQGWYVILTPNASHS